MKVDSYSFFHFIIQITYYLVDVWFLLNFYCIQEKRKRKYILYLFFSFFLFYSEMNFPENLLIIMLFIKLFFVFLFSFVLTKDSLLSLIGSMLIYMVPLIADNFYGVFWSLYFDTFYYRVDFFIDSVFSLFLLGIVFFLYRMIYKNWIPSKENKKFVFFLGLPLLALFSNHQFIAIAQLDESGFFLENIKSTIDTKQVFGITFFSLIFLFCLLFFNKRLTNYIEKEKGYFLLCKKLEYMKEIQTKYDETKSLRHDFKNHMLVVSGLLKENKNNEAEKYIKNLETTINTLNMLIFTGNIVLDVILKEKLFLGKEKNIFIRYDIVIPPHFFMSDIDLSILFSNALNNAMIACEYVEEKNRFIEIFVKKKKDFFIIVVKNSRNKNFEKPEGQGIVNMKMIVKKYNGVMNIKKEEDSFCLEILFFFSQQL